MQRTCALLLMREPAVHIVVVILVGGVAVVVAVPQ
jgi:hypothetical protein